jgi:hypothetical protein
MIEPLHVLDTQLTRLQSESKLKEQAASTERISGDKYSSIPNMMKCYICEGKIISKMLNIFINLDFCIDAVQITCCYENFCDKHIKEELMQNFTCPNCKSASTMRDVVPNMKLRECIDWYRSLMKEGQGQIVNKSSTNLENPINYPAQINPHVIPQFQLPMTNVVPGYPGSYSGAMFNPVRNSIELENKINKPIQLTDEKEMTTEEKMQFYQKLNESESLKKTPEKEDMATKSVKSDEKSSEAKSFTKMNIINPNYANVPPFGMPPGLPYMMKPEQAMMYYRMNPMFYGMPMSYPYPMFPSHLPVEEPPSKKKKDKSKSRSSSKESKKEKKKRSRSRSRHKKREKSRDRHRDKDRHRNSKDRKEKSNKHRKYKY